MDSDRPVRPLCQALVLAASLLAAGCGGGSGGPTAPTPAGSAGSDHAGSAGSDHAQDAVEAQAGEPLTKQEFGTLMKRNNALMKLLKMEIRDRNSGEATRILEELAANATASLRSKPGKNEDQMSAYLALFGAQRTTAQGLKSLVELGAWDAMGPSMATLGKNCLSCHKQFRLSPSQRQVQEAAPSASPAPTTTAP